MKFAITLEKAFYKLHKRIVFQNLKISIENRKGSIRSGVDRDGHEWKTKMPADYGYIRMSSQVRRLGADKEGLDVYVGSNQNSDKVFIIHLMQATDTTKFDEDKVFLGYDNEKEVKTVFNQAYDKAGKKLFGGIVEMNMDALRQRLKIQSKGMIKNLRHILRLDLFKASSKSHTKAHFRRSANGKLIFVKDFDATRHFADHILEVGKTYKVNNPRSQHHGKHAQVTGYYEESGKKKHYVSATIDGIRSDLKPDHFEHVDGGFIKHTPVKLIKRTPVVSIDKAVIPAPAPKSRPLPPKRPGKRPDAPFILDPDDMVDNEYDFPTIFNEWRIANPQYAVKEEDVDASGTTIRYYFSGDALGTVKTLGYIQASKKAKRPHRLIINRGLDRSNPIVDLYREMCEAWRIDKGGVCDLRSALGDAGIRLKQKKDDIFLAGNTYAHRLTLEKWADFNKATNEWKVKDPSQIYNLVEELPPFYTKEDLDVTDRGTDGRVHTGSTGSGTGDTGTALDGDLSDGGSPGTADARRDRSSGAGGAGSPGPDGGTSVGTGSTGASSGKRLKDYTIQELVEITNRSGVKHPDPHVKIRSKLGSLTLFDHQKEGAEVALSTFNDGGKGFLLADDVGTGKTYTAAAIIKGLNPKRAIISVPNDGVRKQWIQTLADAGIAATSAEGTKTDFSKTLGILVCTDTTLSLNETLYDNPSDLFIIDEAHRNKNLAESDKKADKAEAAYTKVQHQMLSGGKTLYLTATPWEKPWQAKIYEALEMWPKDGFDAWVEKHSVQVIVKNKINRKTGIAEEHRSYANIGNGRAATKRTLINRIRNIADGKFLAREIHPEGVSLSNYFHKVELEPETKKQYEFVMEFMKTASKSAKSRKIKRMLGGQRVLWARRFMEAAKLPATVAAAKKELALGRKVAILTGYKSAADVDKFSDMIIDKCKHMDPGSMIDFKTNLSALGDKIEGTFDVLKIEFPGAVFYHGSISNKAKQKAKHEYNHGTASVFIATQASADTGLDLHDTIGTTPRSQINLTIPWSAIAMKQLAGRSHRLGTKSDTKMHWLFGDDPSERTRAEMVSRKMEIMGASSTGIDVTASDDLYQRLVDFDSADGEEAVEYKGSPLAMHKSYVGYVINLKKFIQ
ncbi:MAG: DEAD/DEAH box helicase family protein [Desulfobacterales bacterium]|nr:DEAD/DEAH box helicase family protein [Desulfobacterales bacterium]